MKTKWKVDILIKVLWPLKSPMPGWSVLMQMVSKEASHHNRTPVTTFDQPLYWKALIISCDEECKNIIVRLGGFLYGNELFRKHRSTDVRDGLERVIRVSICT
jgi:hypothetical protein